MLVAINALTVRVVNRHPRLIRQFEGDATVIVEHGHPIHRAIRRLGLRLADVAAALRHQGAAHVGEVEQATLAPGGAIVVTLNDDAQDVTVGDLRDAHQALLADIRREIQAAFDARESGPSDASVQRGA